MMTTDEITGKIQSHLPDADVRIEDPMNDGVHLRAIIISPSFEGKSAVERHRMVYTALGDAFDGPLHALQMVIRTPEEQEKQA